jgi:hypothetical protein
MRKDLIFGLSVIESLPTTVVSGGGDNGVDVNSLLKYAVKHIIHVEAVTTAITVKLQESSVGGGSGYTDVAADQIIGGVNLVSVSASDDNSAVQIAGFNLKQFQRIVTVAGAGTCHAVAVLADNLSV